ncbi:putative LOC107395839-like protein, partial [Nothobranchius furzeri]
SCNPCKNVPPRHKSKTRLSLQKREKNKQLSREAGPQKSVLQWTNI